MAINKLIEDIVDVLCHVNIRITHCYKEPNQLIDWLANMVMNSSIFNTYLSTQHLPTGINGKVTLLIELFGVKYNSPED